MPLIYLVRHGRAAGGYGEELDPGLDDLGRTQGFVVLEALKDIEPLQIWTSPMRRCQETAVPLAKRWGKEPIVVDAVSEVASGDLSVEERGKWINKVIEGKWSDAGDDVTAWRQGFIEALATIQEDTVVFTHFVAINAAIGHATGASDVLSALVENGSITKIQIEDGNFELIETGKEVKRTRVR